MTEYIIALDVGGTTTKAAIVNTNLEIVESSLKIYDSYANESSEIIIDNFISIIIEQANLINAKDGTAKSICFGFPGPFDYKNGISYMKALGKFENIYGIKLLSAIRSKLSCHREINIAENIPILFENDATLFALGEYEKRKSEGLRRCMVITIGTGCGSTFIEDGHVISGKMGVPQSGMIYDQPFKNGIVDDFISRRYILNLAVSEGFEQNSVDVMDLFLLANDSDDRALRVFEQFGKILGEVLWQYIHQFNPQEIIFGGRISQAYIHFEKAFKNYIRNFDSKISVSKDLSRSAIQGAAALAIACSR